MIEANQEKLISLLSEEKIQIARQHGINVAGSGKCIVENMVEKGHYQFDELSIILDEKNQVIKDRNVRICKE